MNSVRTPSRFCHLLTKVWIETTIWIDLALAIIAVTFLRRCGLKHIQTSIFRIKDFVTFLRRCGLKQMVILPNVLADCSHLLTKVWIETFLDGRSYQDKQCHLLTKVWIETI